MSTGSEVPWQITISGIEEANRAQDVFILWRQRVSHTLPGGGGVYSQGNFWKMGMGIIPRVYKRSTLTIRIALCLLLIRVVRFKIGGLFAYISRGGIIRGNLFSLMTGRTLAFHQCQGEVVDWSKWVIVFKREDTMKKGKRRKCLCLECQGNLS